MKKFFFLMLLILSNFVTAREGIPIQSKGTGGNFMGPTIRAQVSKDFCYGGVGGLIEAGFRQFRANGTVGFALGSEKRDGIKGSVDYLTQELKFNFISGSERRWLHQVAGGLAYQHVFNVSILNDVFADGYYSHSWNRDLGKKRVDVKILNGEDAIFNIKHGIAGADAWGLGSGVDLQIFSKTILGLKLNYDHVDYDTKYSKGLTKSGVGGTASITQMFPQDISLGLLAAFRKPFNYYSGSLTWSPRKVSGLSVGIFGDHTAGKHRLPSSYDLGVSVGYAFGPKSSSSKKDKNGTSEVCNSLVGGWLVQPAVYMPQVLAVADQSIVGIDNLDTCFELLVEGPSLLTVTIPAGFAIQSNFTITDETSPTASVHYIMYDASGAVLYDSPTREPQGTYPIPPGIDPADVRTITFENAGQIFRFVSIVCRI